jgi:hypothetical protein
MGTNEFKPQSAAEILSNEPQPIDWVVEPLFASGDLFIFAAYMKVGKSTFSYPLALAVARGIPFLGFQCKQGGVLILALEEHRRNVELRLRKLGMTSEDAVYVHTGPLPSDVGQLNRIRSFIKDQGIILVLLDSLSYWWNIKNENDNAEVVRLLKPVLILARETGAAIGLIHHESKFGGRNKRGNFGDGKSIRGGSALFGVVDQAILLDKRHGGAPNQRVLKTVGRYAESPAELIIELTGNPSLSDPSEYGYSVLGTPNELTEEEARAKLFAALGNEPQDLKAIVLKTELPEKRARLLLDRMFNEKVIIRVGKGVKGDGYKYLLVGDSFQGSTEPLVGKETNTEATSRVSSAA